MLIDAHMHLGALNSALKLVSSLKDRNLTILSSSVTTKNVKEQLNLVKDNSLIKLFAGIHPWFSDSFKDSDSDLDELISDPRISGIGECGLDSFCSVPFEIQLKSFNKQLKMACEYSKPLCLHVRGTHNEVLECLKKYKGLITGIVHGFNSSVQIAKEYRKLGFYLSLGHQILKPSKKMLEVIDCIGPEGLVLESDYEEKSLSEYDLDAIKSYYQKLCEITHVEYESLQNIISNNINSILENSR